jgi:hypothetical protein
VKNKEVNRLNKPNQEAVIEEQETDVSSTPKQIKVSDDVYQDLTGIGKKNETYSQIIRRVLDFYKQHNNK